MYEYFKHCRSVQDWTTNQLKTKEVADQSMLQLWNQLFDENNTASSVLPEKLCACLLAWWKEFPQI